MRLGSYRVAFALAVLYLVWGSTYLAIRFAIETTPPFLMAGSRFVVAGGLMWGFLKLRGAMERTTADQWRTAFLLGGLFFLGGNGGVVWGEQRVPSGITALIVATTPLWLTLLEAVLPGSVRPRPIQTLGLLIGFVGVGLLVFATPSDSSQKIDPVGAIAIVGATLSWAVATVLGRRSKYRQPASYFVFTSMQMLGGGTLLLLAGTLGGEWGRLHLEAVSAKSALSIAFLVVFGSILAFSAYTWLVHHTSPVRLGTYAYVNPVVAVALGALFADETVTGLTLVAGVVIVLAVFLIVSSRA